MKRSEMVMVAAKAMYRRHVDAIKAKHPGCSYNISVAQFYKDAKFMMNAIEEAGMLPPLCKEEDLDIKVHGGRTEYIELCTRVHFKWEKE